MREQIRRAGLDPLHEVEPTRQIVASVVSDYDAALPAPGLPRTRTWMPPNTVLDLVAATARSRTWTTPRSRRSGINGPA
ncbi:hypothetical protein QJS66_22925 [Kocuria rhizophila]|nr:hypothetical protein QJS66_22925 [Kocuria rhizophila]